MTVIDWAAGPSRAEAIEWLDRDAAVRDLAAAYAVNGRPPAHDPTYPDDATTPHVARPHRCPCGLTFIARRDRDAHRLTHQETT